MTLWFVLGTAAELIKVVSLIRGAEARGWHWRVVVTGQSSKNFWAQYDDFQLPRAQAHVALVSDQDLAHSGQALRWFLRALTTSPSRWIGITEAPQYVVVHGDTLSTLVGATWAWRLGLPLAHVEAGLRSSSWLQPFPEEICRRLVSRLAQVHFAPDEVAQKNLRVARGQVVQTGGNSLLDVVRSETKSPVQSAKSFCVVNLHRYENLRSPSRWSQMVRCVLAAAREYRVVFVMHPQTEQRLNRDPQSRAQLLAAGVELKPRLLFSEFLGLVKASAFVISDGGSNQEECHYLGKPCLLLRDTTERQEGLGGACVLSHFSEQVIADFLADPKRYATSPVNPALSPSTVILNTFASLDERRDSQ